MKFLYFPFVFKKSLTNLSMLTSKAAMTSLQSFKKITREWRKRESKKK